MSKVLEKIEEKLKNKKYQCKQCDIHFPTRQELGKHIYDVHNHTKDVPKKHVVPLEFVNEFKYLTKGAYAKISAEGQITDKGFEVDRFKYL